MCASPVRILQLTDSHFPAIEGNRIQGVDAEQSFRAVAGTALGSERSYDLMLLTGDLVDTPLESAYLRLRDCLLALDTSIPCYCLAGNHDEPGEMAKFLLGGNIQMTPRILLAHWQIVCMDSTVPGHAEGVLQDSQLEMLHQSMDAHPEKHLLVAVHHHPIPCGSAWMDTMMIRNAERLLTALQTVRNRACAVVFGHIHQALDRTISGIRFLACPSTCCQFKPHSREFRLDELPPGYRWINLHENGEIATGVEYLSY